MKPLDEITQDILASLETLSEIERRQEEAIREGIREIDRNLPAVRVDPKGATQ